MQVQFLSSALHIIWEDDLSTFTAGCVWNTHHQLKAEEIKASLHVF